MAHQRWRTRDGAPKIAHQQTPAPGRTRRSAEMAHQNTGQSPTFQNHNLLIPSNKTPALGEKPVNLSPFPILFDGKTEGEKEKTGHEKAENPHYRKKTHLKYADWHPITYKNSATQKHGKSTPAKIASSTNPRHFFGTLLGPLLYSSSIKRTFAYENYWNGKCITFISSH
ncbi:MAG: hypothetical protein WC098_03755 [Bacteroidales bacterium]